MIVKTQATGFTLIELLVTVVIIGILTSISIVNFEEYRKFAYDAHAISGLNTIIQAANAYLDGVDGIGWGQTYSYYKGVENNNLDLGQLLPDFGNEDLFLWVQYQGSLGSPNFLYNAFHCKGRNVYSFNDTIGIKIVSEILPIHKSFYCP